MDLSTTAPTTTAMRSRATTAPGPPPHPAGGPAAPPPRTRPGVDAATFRWRLLAGTALLYLWGLGASGWANSYGRPGKPAWSWLKAFFFGSFDAAGNAITVDKTPLSRGCSGRRRGRSSSRRHLRGRSPLVGWLYLCHGAT